MSKKFISGFVAVVGRPNVGKSTLVNALVGQPLSIESAHPHTTRTQVRAIDNGRTHQIVYVDTPGIHKAHTLLSENMNDAAYDALAGVDMILAVFDARSDIGPGDRYIAERLAVRKNVCVVLSHVDAAPSLEDVARRGAELAELLPLAATIFYVSGFTGRNVGMVREYLIENLPEGARLFEASQSHDMTDEFLVAELFREALLHRMRDELPQEIAVIAYEDSTREKKSDFRRFSVAIFVSRPSMKPIVIGTGGSVLAESGTAARLRAETLLDSRVVLDAKVHVDDTWKSRPEFLDTFFL